MPHHKPKLTDRAWAEVFAAAVGAKGNKPTGDGWKTFDQIRAENGWGPNHARVWRNEMMEAGRLEVFNGSETKPGKKQALKQRWYRPKALK